MPPWGRPETNHLRCRRYSRLASTLVVSLTVLLSACTASEDGRELRLASFVGSRHPIVGAVFNPLAEDLEAASGGQLTLQQFPGATLNSAPAQQYSRLVERVADISFGLPGYTMQRFPMTALLGFPGMSPDAITGTERLWRAMPAIEAEYEAKILGLWAAEPKLLISATRRIDEASDLQGMIVSAASVQDVAYLEQVGAAAVSLPTSEAHQALTTGTIDAVFADPSTIASFSLWEPARFITSNFPPIASAFFLLMNREVYEELTPQERAWVDSASGLELSLRGAQAYVAAAERGMTLAERDGIEFITMPEEELARINAAFASVMENELQREYDNGLTGADVIALMTGQQR